MTIGGLLRGVVHFFCRRNPPEADSPRRLGRYGENKAARFLRRKGYRILSRNVTTPVGEVDILALKGDTLVCVEVKTRIAGGPYDAVEAVSSTRLERMKRCAEYVARQPRFRALQFRLDAVFVTVDEGASTTLEHIDNIG